MHLEGVLRGMGEFFSRFFMEFFRKFSFTWEDVPQVFFTKFDFFKGGHIFFASGHPCL